MFNFIRFGSCQQFYYFSVLAINSTSVKVGGAEKNIKIKKFAICNHLLNFHTGFRIMGYGIIRFCPRPAGAGITDIGLWCIIGIGR